MTQPLFDRWLAVGQKLGVPFLVSAMLAGIIYKLGDRMLDQQGAFFDHQVETAKELVANTHVMAEANRTIAGLLVEIKTELMQAREDRRRAIGLIEDIDRRSKQKPENR